MLQELHGWCGIVSLMVEGGAGVLSVFVKQADELVDCVYVTIATRTMVGGRGVNTVGNADLV